MYSKWINTPSKLSTAQLSKSKKSSEEEVCEFIQCVCDSSEDTFLESPKYKRNWTGQFSKLPVHLNVSNIKCKPDFLVLDESVDIKSMKGKDNEWLNWKLIKAFGQYKETFHDMKTEDFQILLKEMHNLAYCIF